MIDCCPESFHERSEEPTDWEALMEGYDWKINIPTDPDDPSFKEGLDIVNELRERYGQENVIANLAVMDPDTEKLTRVQGRLGVHVRAGAKPTDSV